MKDVLPAAAVFCVLFVAIVNAGCAPHLGVTRKGLEKSNATWEELEPGFAPRRWAVVIGIDDFDDPTFTRLRHARDDAREFARVLASERYGAFDRVITLVTPERTDRRSILFELSRLRGDVRRQDTLVVYFSGHGTLEMSEDGQPRLYLVARDTRLTDLAGTGIDVEALRTFLHSLKPQRKVLILDSCFAGAGKSRVANATRKQLKESVELWSRVAMSVGQSEAVLMASTLGGVALEDDSLRHAAYTYYLLNALTEDRAQADANRDGAVTAYEAHDFARVATMAHTEGEQVPEGYFRVIGRAEMYLSGAPDPEMAKEAALVYAYGGASARGMTLAIDGRSKGAFPRTVAVEPGDRRVEIRDAMGRVVADGRLRFARGQVYTLALLEEELLGYRRFFGMDVGGAIQASGPAELLWGKGAPRLAAVSGYRVRGGALRGLCVSFALGWTPATGGSWVDAIDTTQRARNIVDLGTSIVMRRNVWKTQVGVGWHASATYVPAVASESGSRPAAQAEFLPSQTWLLLPGGPVFWQGTEIGRNILATTEVRGSLVWGDYTDVGDQMPNLLITAVAGIEIGF